MPATPQQKAVARTTHTRTTARTAEEDEDAFSFFLLLENGTAAGSGAGVTVGTGVGAVVGGGSLQATPTSSSWSQYSSSWTPQPAKQQELSARSDPVHVTEDIQIGLLWFPAPNLPM